MTQLPKTNLPETAAGALRELTRQGLDSGISCLNSDDIRRRVEERLEERGDI